MFFLQNFKIKKEVEEINREIKINFIEIFLFKILILQKKTAHIKQWNYLKFL
jgi:hypothetical protein